MLQTFEMRHYPSDPEVQKTVANYARYQAQHDRLFQRALHDLLKLRAERRKAEIGFESQKRAQAQETRREATETRKQEHHKATMSILETRRERELTHTAAVNKVPDTARMEKMAA
jgi:IMP dehydrogenase/GMP reductase